MLYEIYHSNRMKEHIDNDNDNNNKNDTIQRYAYPYLQLSLKLVKWTRKQMFLICLSFICWLLSGAAQTRTFGTVSLYIFILIIIFCLQPQTWNEVSHVADMVDSSTHPNAHCQRFWHCTVRTRSPNPEVIINLRLALTIAWHNNHHLFCSLKCSFTRIFPLSSSIFHIVGIHLCHMLSSSVCQYPVQLNTIVCLHCSNFNHRIWQRTLSLMLRSGPIPMTAILARTIFLLPGMKQ